MDSASETLKKGGRYAGDGFYYRFSNLVDEFR